MGQDGVWLTRRSRRRFLLLRDQADEQRLANRLRLLDVRDGEWRGRRRNLYFHRRYDFAPIV